MKKQIMPDYYYAENDEQFGPFSLEELKNKRIKKSTLVWTDGMPEWNTAENLIELQGFITSGPPPLPKKLKNTKDIAELKTSTKSNVNSIYESNYQKETEAVIIGIILFIIPFLLKESGALTFESIERSKNARFAFSIGAILIRILVTYWVVNISSRQNRNTARWGLFAFLLPSVALIIIGFSEKLKIEIEIDSSLSTKDQVLKYIEIAKSYFSKKRYTDCIEILNKALEIDNQNYECYRLSGLSKYNLQKFEESQKDFEYLLKNGHFLSEAYLYLGKIALEKHKREHAIELWFKAKELGNTDVDEYLDLYFNFSFQYLIPLSQLIKKIGPSFDWEEVTIFNYMGGFEKLDVENEYINKEIFIKHHSNGISLEFRKGFKSIYFAIAYYEIEHLLRVEAEQKIEIHLMNNLILKFNYKDVQESKIFTNEINNYLAKIKS